MATVRTAVDIGSVIKTARGARGLTQTQLAKLAGVHQPKISEIERGKKTAHIGIVLRILASLDLTIDIGGHRPQDIGTANPTVAEVLIDEPTPDETIDIDQIVDSRRR